VSHGMYGSTGALSSRETGSEAAGRVAASEPSLAGRYGPEPRDTLQRVDACPAPCLRLEAGMQGYPVCRVLTVATGPMSGEATNLQVGPISTFPVQSF
jgi:hypothetical protein